MAFFFTARFLTTPCKPQRPQRPKKLGGHGMTDSRVLLVWSKYLGYGYQFTLTVKSGSVIVQVLKGTSGFGYAKAFIVNGLIPNTQYTFEVTHTCASDPTKSSTPKTFTCSTLQAGKELKDQGCRMMYDAFDYLLYFYHLHLQEKPMTFHVNTLLKIRRLPWVLDSVTTKLEYHL